jgi:pimeloyl-ACP methyl ester carboxylesterase
MTDKLQPTEVGLGLEVIEKGICTRAHPVPLLFVHGAWHAAWCWEPFVDYFADKGYRALAVSLRGHGTSPSPKGVRRCSLADYVDDVKSVAENLPSMPVLIGHSMGGFVVQKYLESNEAPAGVLVASAPPQGGGRFARHLLRSHPWLMVRTVITGDAAHGYNTPRLARRWFFSAATPEEDVVRCAAMIGNESARVGLDTAGPNALRPERVTTPLLVLGAELDACITEAELRDTARAYGTEPEIFGGMGHNMMLDTGWTAVAERIDSWLGGRGL